LLTTDDTPVNGKRPTGRKWKNWSVILTGSQLLFFKDTILALTLVEQIRNAATSGVRMTGFQPDEVLSVKDCVAIWDRDYYDGAFTFRFIMPGGYQFLMQTLDEKEMNEWLTLINYASTFKSAGIRMRATAIDSGDAKLAGTAAAESHVKDLETGTPSPKVSTPPPQARSVFFTQPSAFEEPPMVRPKLRRVGSLRSAPTPRVDIAGANDVVVGGGEQIEAVIGSVKAELAAGRGAARPLSMDPGAQASTPPLHKSLRTEAIQDRVTKLRNSAGVIERRLATNLRIARNLALLTPFQRVTRDRIEAAVPDLANQIRADRIDLAKLHLWITMLLKDQERDEREWARVRHVALQAAAKSLRTGLTVADRRATLAHPITIPKLSLPPDSEEQLWGAGTNAAGEADRDAEDGAITATPVSSGLASPFTPGLMSPLAVVRGDSSSSELLISTDLSGSHSASGAPSNASNANSNVSTPDVAPDSAEPSSARTSSGSGSSEYELASEYLSAESRLSLHDELERHFAPDSPALSSLGSSLGSISGSGMSIGMRNGTVVKVHNGSANVNVNGGAGAGANGNAHVRLVSPDDREERLDDEADDDDEERDTVSPSTLAKKPPTATEERAEHWRHTRAATKVSLARMPRKSLDEIQARITHGQGHGHGHGSG
jgi:hypothetical protein